MAPAIIELDSLSALEREVFGPVLHVLRFRRDGSGHAVDAINATGYGLTFGVHTRIDETVARVTAARQGRQHLRQPQPGRRGGGRAAVRRPRPVRHRPEGGRAAVPAPAAGASRRRHRIAARPTAARCARLWADWLAHNGSADAQARFGADLAATPFGVTLDLPGPVGERNVYSTVPRGTVRCVAATPEQLLHQIGAALATGNRAVVDASVLSPPTLPVALADWITQSATPEREEVAAILFAGPEAALRTLNQAASDRDGPIRPVHRAGADGAYPLEWLVAERCVSTNTAAAGGNAGLMMIG